MSTLGVGVSSVCTKPGEHAAVRHKLHTFTEMTVVTLHFPGAFFYPNWPLCSTISPSLQQFFLLLTCSAFQTNSYIVDATEAN